MQKQKQKKEKNSVLHDGLQVTAQQWMEPEENLYTCLGIQLLNN